ncbi:hypothetical protein CLE01_31570 [Cryobacterium levicorallinum]|nr:hypothetical protein CLE01_31570 [Cryobacterium levicorallinum]
MLLAFIHLADDKDLMVDLVLLKNRPGFCEVCQTFVECQSTNEADDWYVFQKSNLCCQIGQVLF